MLARILVAEVESADIENCPHIPGFDLTGWWLARAWSDGEEIYAGVFDSEAEARYRLDRLGSRVSYAAVVQPEGPWSSDDFYDFA